MSQKGWIVCLKFVDNHFEFTTTTFKMNKIFTQSSEECEENDYVHDSYLLFVSH